MRTGFGYGHISPNNDKNPAESVGIVATSYRIALDGLTDISRTVSVFTLRSRWTGRGTMISDICDKELCTEKLMNMILDVIDDIIIIHDTEHIIVWMNRAAENAFGISVDDAIGTKCYTLFGYTMPCPDCTVSTMSFGRPSQKVVRRIPRTGKTYDCSTITYCEDGEIKMVVQHLRESCGDEEQRQC